MCPHETIKRKMAGKKLLRKNSSTCNAAFVRCLLLNISTPGANRSTPSQPQLWLPENSMAIANHNFVTNSTGSSTMFYRLIYP